MTIATEGLTIGQVFAAAVARHRDRPFLLVPADPARAWAQGGATITYGDADARVTAIKASLTAAGYGPGHRIAVLLGNRPEILLMKLACNALGLWWVPVNPDYRAGEIAWVIDDGAVDLMITAPDLADAAAGGITASARPALPCWTFRDDLTGLPLAPRPAPEAGPVTPETIASVLYTSGTTGRPKGCLLSHGYELMMGEWYATCGGRLELREGVERVYCPLPAFHVNAGILLFYGMMVTGNCQIMPERFSRTRFWAEVRATGATAMHYLGVVIPVLMNDPPGPQDRDHGLRWGLGAGVEPTLHKAFEDRFGLPLVEIWGMTEMCRLLADCHEPRGVGTRAIGRPVPGLDVRVADEHDAPVPPGTEGEMLVRHSAETPRKGAFSGYLNLPEATEHSWRGGWFHTGDVVRQDADGLIHFVDRRKNIVRRSGENIAAAEVEASLQGHPAVAQVAVIAVPDAMRDEEVMACVVARPPEPGAALARALFDHCFTELAYYKAPGWVVFVPELPVTGTQKVLKHRIFGDGQDPCAHPAAHDLRPLKKRDGHG